MSIILLSLSLISIALMILVALQAKRGDLSFMGASSDSGKKFERRGPEKALHNLTVICVLAFVALSLVQFLLF
jgi:protein translocase SecG subunit